MTYSLPKTECESKPADQEETVDLSVIRKSVLINYCLQIVKGAASSKGADENSLMVVVR